MIKLNLNELARIVADPERQRRAAEMRKQVDAFRAEQQQQQQQVADPWEPFERARHGREAFAELIAEKLREPVRPKAKAPRNREASLDAMAVAVVDMFEDPTSADHRPNWAPKDVVEVLRPKRPTLTTPALIGKQRDGTRRCPKFWDRWQDQKAKAAERRGRLRVPR
jgi:hypothetical protein